jgi:hypothetical protein
VSSLGTQVRRFGGYLLAASLATAAVAETHSIGTLGATIPVGSWERRTLSSDFGPDQFLRTDRSYCMVFLETFELYEERADFMEGLDLYVAGIQARAPDASVDPEIGYSRSADFSRATRRLSAVVSGVELGYQLDLVSAGDGVGYVVMSWSPLSGFDGLQEEIERTLTELRLPGPDSEWSQRATPSAHDFSFDDWTVELRYRDSVFTEGDSQPGQRYSLVASGGGIAVHVFLDDLEGDADDVLDQVKRVATNAGAYEELLRSDLDLEVGQGRQLLMRSDEDPPNDMAIAVIGLGEDRWVDVRMATSDRAGLREHLWDRLLASIRVTPPEEIDAFPVVSESADAEADYVGPSARRLLTASRSLGAHGSEVVAVRENDATLLRESNRLTLVPPNGSEAASTEVLYQGDEYMAGQIVAWGERTLLVAADGEISEVVDGRLQPTGFEADVVASADAELLIARNGRREPLFGFADLPAVGPAEILVRGADGEERLLLELPAEDVEALSHRRTGDVLAAVAPRTVLSAAGESPAKRLVLVRGGEDRRAEEIARWDRIDRLEPAPGGWLVTGAPSAGRQGVHLVDDGGHSELLLSGDPVGLSLADGELTFVTGTCLEPTEGYYSRCVYRADLDLVRELGPAFQPFTAQVLNQIGARVRPQVEGGYVRSFPPTREAISDLATAAGEAALELVGTDLPRSGAGVDALLGALAYDRDLSEAGVVLLSVLLSDSLLRDGAVWEPATEPRPPARGTFGWELKNAFAVGLHPVTVVLSALYDEEGWYTPTEGIAQQARGRTIVLGLDPERVRARVRAAELPKLANLLRAGRVSPLAAVLEGQPKNVYLRETVYEHLAAHGHHAELAKLAEAFAARDDAQGVDLLAWMAARLAGELSPAEVSDAIADLRDAIERAPSEAGLYLLLGATYERTAEPDRLTLARASYRKAQETVPWGSLHAAAEQALERLADAE